MRIPVLIMLAVTLARAQSAPPRKDIPAIAKAANGAIVSIIMSDKDGHPIAQGTGFFVSKNGRIVTNYHVIQSGSSAIVKLPNGAFFAVDGVLAFDKARDIAVIKAHGENFRTVTLGDSDGVRVGEEVVAIGNPLSLESTVSNGIVSGIRTVEEEGGKFLQVTTPISPGSSGGPLFNMAGEVVGITTLYLKGGENLSFAIPINDPKPMLQTGYSKLMSFPDEPGREDDTTRGKNTAAKVVGHPRTGREFYQQLYDSGGFAELVAEDEKYPPGISTHYVCSNDDENSGEFFVFTARRFDQEYSDATVALMKVAKQYEDAGLTHGEAMHDPKVVQALQTMEKVQESAPYVMFLMGDWAKWVSITGLKNPWSRLGTLSADFYEKGVRGAFAQWGWDENSGSWLAYNSETTSDSVTRDWTFRLSIEPRTLRYIESKMVILTLGKASDSKSFEESGVCEKITDKRPD